MSFAGFIKYLKHSLSTGSVVFLILVFAEDTTHFHVRKKRARYRDAEERCSASEKAKPKSKAQETRNERLRLK